jgi:Holliday junction resolvase RusA-like endonuclease
MKLKIPKTISLNKYRNEHYFKLNEIKAEYKLLVRFAIQEAQEEIKPLKTPIKTAFSFANYRNRDLDGEVISIKFFHDALTELGMIPDDNRKHLKGIEIKELDEKGSYYFVDIKSI